MLSLKSSFFILAYTFLSIMVKNYAFDKRKLVSCPMIITAIIIFFLVISMVGIASVAGSMSSMQIGGQELQEQQRRLQTTETSDSSNITDGH
jgi:hypothetical protein